MESLERPRFAAGPFSSLVVFLFGDDVGRARTFFALSDLKLDLLALIEGCVACGLDLRVMDKQVFPAVVRINEAKALT
jgi:hypothetical protein